MIDPDPGKIGPAPVGHLMTCAGVGSRSDAEVGRFGEWRPVHVHDHRVLAGVATCRTL